jgi:hypothetical protein
MGVRARAVHDVVRPAGAALQHRGSDYNGDGLVDSADIQWIGQNSTSRVQNMPSFDGVTAQRSYHGLQFVGTKRYSNRWQALVSFLYSSSSGMARRSLRQDVNVEGPMFWDDNWMGTLNQTINNLEGPLPFTPKYEFKLSGSYLIPKIELDAGLRYRMHSGRPMWQLETYPQHTQWAAPEGGVIDPGGTGQIVGVGDPVYLPNQNLVDLHLDKVVKINNTQSFHVVLDGFNIFNSSSVTDMDTLFEYGKVTAIPQARWFRLGLRYQF